MEAGGIVKYDVKLVVAEEGGTSGPAGPRGGAAVGGAVSTSGGTKRKAEAPAAVSALGPAAKVRASCLGGCQGACRSCRTGSPFPVPARTDSHSSLQPPHGAARSSCWLHNHALTNSRSPSRPAVRRPARSRSAKACNCISAAAAAAAAVAGCCWECMAGEVESMCVVPCSLSWRCQLNCGRC